MKHDMYLCSACSRCSDPDLYCKFRTACGSLREPRGTHPGAPTGAGMAGGNYNILNI